MATLHLVSALKRLGYLFYVADEDVVFVEDLDTRKSVTTEAIPAFFILLFIEGLINRYHGKSSERLKVNDACTSISQGLVMEMCRALSGGMDMIFFVYIYDHFRLFSLPWNSWWTWLVVLLLTDLAYYWGHRAAHEVNILWAGHQVHHSSEYYNLTTALRQSVVSDHINFLFFLPMALFVPPAIYTVHHELNTLFQFWIHTEAVRSVGPLEWILNTPSHHRVHHGVNRYCIDKNYAGVLIIWDRMFGTFQKENEGEEIVYGVTHPVKTFDPFKIQFHYLRYVVRRFRRQKTWSNALSVLFKGPGWSPGKPRLGNKEDLPDVHAPVSPFNPQTSSWISVYAVVQYVILLTDHMSIADDHNFNKSLKWIVTSYSLITFGIYNIGLMFENQKKGYFLEVMRLSLYMVLTVFVFPYRIRFSENKVPSLIKIFVPVNLICFTFSLHRFLTFEEPQRNRSSMPKPLAE